MDVMATLTDAGAADTGPALVEAIARGHEAPVKFRLQQQLERPLADRVGYMDNSLNESGATPLPLLLWPASLLSQNRAVTRRSWSELHFAR